MSQGSEIFPITWPSGRFESSGLPQSFPCCKTVTSITITFHKSGILVGLVSEQLLKYPPCVNCWMNKWLEAIGAYWDHIYSDRRGTPGLFNTQCMLCPPYGYLRIQLDICDLGHVLNPSQSPFSYLFKKNFILYWSIVDLQCCVGFRRTAKWYNYA